MSFMMRAVIIGAAVFLLVCGAGFCCPAFAVMSDADFIELCRGGLSRQIDDAIKNGANVNARDGNGRTPLMYAAWNNVNPEVITTLIEAGADVNVANKNGDTPLMYAAQLNGIDVPNHYAMRLLISAGADVVSPSATLEIKEEATKELLSVASDANMNDVFRLIQNGANVNAVDEYGWTPLMLAVAYNYNLVSKADTSLILIGCGADVNAVDRNGWTPLMLASWNNRGYIARTLADLGADVDMKDKKGRKARDYEDRNDDRNELVKEINAYRRRGITYTEGSDLALYHPWGDNSLARLDSPASLRISGNYPRLDGGTSSYPLYAAVVNEVYAINDKEELEKYLNCSRTDNAYRRLTHGEVDMILVVQPSDEQLQRAKDAGLELHFTPLAKDAFVFIVNDGNPVSGLSVEQIRNIYLEKITNWREVGGNDRKILPFQRNPNSGSQTAMEKEVMKGEALPPPLGRRFNEMYIMVGGVSQYRDQEESIGYSYRFFTEEMVRTVMNENKKEAESLSQYPPDSDDAHKQYLEVLKPVKLLAVDGIEPSVENIRNGTYPFTISVYAVTTGKSNPRSQELIDWMLSPQGQELIEKTGFVGVVGSGE